MSKFVKPIYKFEIEKMRPQFPLNLTANDLMANAKRRLEVTGKVTKIPNSFMAYRMAVKKNLILSKNIPGMRELSTISATLWKTEPEWVKAEYQSLMRDAQAQLHLIANFKLPLQIIQFTNQMQKSLEPSSRNKFESRKGFPRSYDDRSKTRSNTTNSSPPTTPESWIKSDDNSFIYEKRNPQSKFLLLNEPDMVENILTTPFDLGVNTVLESDISFDFHEGQAQRNNIFSQFSNSRPFTDMETFRNPGLLPNLNSSVNLLDFCPITPVLEEICLEDRVKNLEHFFYHMNLEKATFMNFFP
ncbi:hypothetical protein G9A89_004494 [Geosiphon pyriformis]|nr:hypothetical protein G9A89_004494 [Geosiphon pyriformis]